MSRNERIQTIKTMFGDKKVVKSAMLNENNIIDDNKI